MTAIALFLRGLKPGDWLAIAIAAAVVAAAIGLYAMGGAHTRSAVRLDKAEARAVAGETGAAAQKDLDRAVTDIGDGVATQIIETVRVVERVKVEVRDAAAKEPDPLPRLTDFAARANGLRDQLHLDGPAGADGGDAGRDP